MKLLVRIVSVAVPLALGGCASPDARQASEGLIVDHGCADFYQASPAYGGNRLLAYAANCTNPSL